MTPYPQQLAELARAAGLHVSDVGSPDGHNLVVNGLRLHYLDWGTRGRAPVVFLHGGGLSAHTWDLVCLALRPDYHCYALDLRGHGDSEWSPTLEYGLDAHLRDIEAFVNQITSDRCFLIGHSLGGFVAIRYAARHSDRLAGLVVVDASPFVRSDAAGVARVRDFMLGRTAFDSIDDAVDYALTFNPARDRRILRASVERALRRGPDGRWTWKRDQRHLSPQYFADTVAEARALVADAETIRCATLVVRGSNGCSANEAAEFASLVGNARVVTVEGAGHNVQRDNPAGLVEVLRPFLAANNQTVSGSVGPRGTVDFVEGLRSIYRPPAQRALDKEIDHLDAHCRDFLAHSPFVVLASRSDDGRVDASPKGGPPGFVAVLDDHHLAIPDLAGNNRLDSMRNIVHGGGVALLCMVPGVEETLRVNGQATICVDPNVLDHCPIAGLRPNVALVVAVRSAFVHCAKALRRAALWDPDRWPETADMATPACMLRDHIGLDGTVEDSQRALDASYTTTTWQVGGQDATDRA